MVECKLGKNWPSNFMFHLSFLKKLFPYHTHPHISICEFSKPYELLFLEFESFVKCKIWIVKKSLNKFYLNSYTSPYIHLWISPYIHLWVFKTLWVIIFWVWASHKWLNANWDNIDSIILSLTCHSLRNFPPIIHIPSYPFMNFWNPMSCYFLSLSH